MSTAPQPSPETFVDAAPSRGMEIPEWRRAASRALHPSAQSVERSSLAAIAEGLAQVTVPWELQTGEAPAERRYEQVLATAAYDAWVIYWPAGFELPLHDHGGSWGAFSVVGGELTEITLVAGEMATNSMRSGATVQFGPDHVHAVANRTTRPATSVHVYSPPLASMAFFAEEDDGAFVAIRDEEPSEWETGR